jgi:hypothetical protein
MLNTTGRAYQRITKPAVLAAVFVLCFAFAQPASADPITGEVAFFGGFTVSGGSGPLDLANATAIDFTGGTVYDKSGSFSVLPVLAPVTLNGFTFLPSFSGPINPLWVVGQFQFALQTLTSVDQGTAFLALAGTGVVSSTIAGLDPTAYDWSFVGTNSSQGITGTLQLYASTASVRVAEPSDFVTLAFSMFGLGALCLWSRRLRTLIQQ